MPSLELDDIVLKSPGVMGREIADGAVLVDMTGGKCWELNQVGSMIWAMLGPSRSLRQTCAELVDRIDIPLAVLESDALTLANHLLDAGLVVRAR